jgi:acetoin:2,6-dichlorophenolindophenol oxidoreductase subunit beta
MVKKSLAAAEVLEKQGISAEVVDPRTLAPLDTKTILESVKKTGRLVLVDQATRHASAAAIIAAEIAEQGSAWLKAPLKMVTALDTSIPFSEPLETFVLPSEEKIVSAVKAVLGKQAKAV